MLGNTEQGKVKWCNVYAYTWLRQTIKRNSSLTLGIKVDKGFSSFPNLELWSGIIRSLPNQSSNIACPADQNPGTGKFLGIEKSAQRHSTQVCPATQANLNPNKILSKTGQQEVKHCPPDRLAQAQQNFDKSERGKGEIWGWQNWVAKEVEHSVHMVFKRHFIPRPVDWNLDRKFLKTKQSKGTSWGETNGIVTRRSRHHAQIDSHETGPAYSVAGKTITKNLMNFDLRDYISASTAPIFITRMSRETSENRALFSNDQERELCKHNYS
ncbi:hypothetical protein K438DRAFT_1780072 [Mycena galopus ATCC 62051]|nr:hypothetical protein K438DRAFT_1780072 [Mycena galopus ATCC 62051]